AKGEQLPGEIRSPARCCHDFLNITAKRMFTAQRIQHQFSVRANDHQKIVEIMRYSASKPAYGVHFLCLLELRFQAAPLGYVAVVGNEMGDRTVCVAQRRDGLLCIEYLPVLLAVGVPCSRRQWHSGWREQWRIHSD